MFFCKKTIKKWHINELLVFLEKIQAYEL